MKCISKTFAIALLAMTAGISAMAENLLGTGNLNNWSFIVHKPVSEAGGSAMVENGKAIVKSPAIKEQKFDTIQLVRYVEVEADRSYKLQFVAKSDKAGKITVAYCLSKPPYAWYANTSVELEPGEKDYECVLSVKRDKEGNYDIPRSIRMYFGSFENAAVIISDVSLEEVK
jgi:hypothetical protein